MRRTAPVNSLPPRRTCSLLAFALFFISATSALAADGTALAAAFETEVERRLALPAAEQQQYAAALVAALAEAETPFTHSQYILLLDRAPNVQAILLYWLDLADSPPRFHYIGAAPASTGKPGRPGYFTTPLGVYAHTLKNRDFRAEGTPNRNGILGYGRKGMRIYDFGWVQAERGWGDGGPGQMRLLLHATDPERLEPQLGTPRSKGCIRIPATLNTFLDRHGLLDADYEQALVNGRKLWVLLPERTPTPWPGRYLVIVDSGRPERPPWSPAPLE
jgi:hypothetical protein